ncbi:MAG: hypothetical protein KIC54_04315 [Clostridium sp.]|nr:hypothetical protein [Clostridium sp.]
MKLCIAGIQFQNLETGEIITFSPETKGVTVDSGRNPTEDEYNIASLASGVIVGASFKELKRVLPESITLPKV